MVPLWNQAKFRERLKAPSILSSLPAQGVSASAGAMNGSNIDNSYRELIVG